MCLVAPYPFHLEPLEDFDPLTDFEMTGGDDVWFARPQLFFSCSLCPTGQMEDKASHMDVSLVFFSTFEQISLTEWHSHAVLAGCLPASNTLCLPGEKTFLAVSR